MRMQEIVEIFPRGRRQIIQKILEGGKAEEIRVRVGQQICVRELDQERVLTDGPMQMDEINEMLSYITRYSLYAFETQMAQGFITIRGGHRIGIGGQVLLEAGKVRNFSYVTFLNVRIATERIGCCKKVLMDLYQSRRRIYNTILFSAPGAGKTTLLRDCVRALSQGTAGYPGQQIALIDERYEVAAGYCGVPQNQLGPRTDVIMGCSKPEGMEMALRSLAPQIIAVDELGGAKDMECVQRAFYCGCSLLGTMHAGGMEELCQKPQIRQWMQTEVLQRIVEIRRRPGKSPDLCVYDARGRCIC